MQEVSHRPIEIGGVGALEHHFEIVALAPVRLRTQLLLDQIVEFRPRQGIGNADADLVGLRLFEQPSGRLDVAELLVHVAQLNEESDAYTRRRLEAFPRRENFRDRRTLVHRIQYALAAASAPRPRFPASGIAQRPGHALADQIGASLNGEWNPGIRLAAGLRRIPPPSRRESRRYRPQTRCGPDGRCVLDGPFPRRLQRRCAASTGFAPYRVSRTRYSGTDNRGRPPCSS